MNQDPKAKPKPMITRRNFLAHSAMATAWLLTLPESLLASQQQNAGDQTPQSLLLSMRAAAASAEIKPAKITDTIFLIQNVGANILVLSGPDGKLLVDSGMATASPHLLDTLNKLAPHPVKILVNTSWLFDHTDGNAALNLAGAFIIAQENTRVRLAAPQKISMFNLDLNSAPASALPHQTFTDSEKLFCNNDQLDLIHAPNASTDSDIFVHLVNANLIHTGELWFNNGYPILDADSGGTINGMIQGVDQILQLADDRTRIVPGHGNAGRKANLATYREMLATIANRVEKMKIAGQTLDQVLAAHVTADFDSEWARGYVTANMFLTAVYNTL